MANKKEIIYLLAACVWMPLGALIHAQEDWLQVGRDIDGEAAGDESGTSVALSSDGSVVAIGAPGNNGNGTGSGHVRVYRNTSAAWVQIGGDINGEAAGDLSGWSVSLNGDGSVVAIGAIENDGNGTDSGHVRIYRNVSGSWVRVGSDINGEAAGDLSGWSVSLNSDGNVVAIGAIANADNGDFSGHVRVYRNVSGSWVKVGSDINGEAAGDVSGLSVSLSADGSIVAIGAQQNDGNGTDSGHVRVYRNVSGSWVRVGGDINGEASGDFSGFSVSLNADGSVVAIGAIFNDGNGVDSGQARVYRNVSGTWVKVGEDIDGEAAGDEAGFSVSLSADGSLVAVGAFGNDGNGNNSGHARIFRNVSGAWVQVGGDIDGEASGDESSEVSLSADGEVVAIGAGGNDGGGSNSGHVRIFGSRAPFSIIAHPLSQTVNFGESFTLEVSVEGTPPFNYQWRKDGRDIAGATLPTYTIEDAQPSDAGEYEVRVSNQTGSRTSLAANVLVLTLPVIETQPSSRAFNVGEAVTFEVSATGAPPLSYQWRKDGVDIEGATSPTYTIEEAKASDAGYYSVEVSNATGSVTSLAAQLILAEPPTILTQPTSRRIGFGETANFSVSATGTPPLSYQWRKDGVEIQGATLGSYTIEAAGFSDEGAYDVEVTNSAGSASSLQASLFVNDPIRPQSWVQSGSDFIGEAAQEYLGSSVSLSSDGKVVAIGSIGVDTIGAVRVYQMVSGAWLQIGQDIIGDQPNDQFGWSVSLSADGNVMAIGAPQSENDFATGYIRVFRNVSDSWVQIGEDIEGEGQYRDKCGSSVSLSADGSLVAIGAPWNNAPGTADSGHVRVYQNISGTWTQVGDDIDGELSFDESGSSVSLSADGSIVAIGAPRNDGSGEDSGHVRVYQNISGTWTQVGDDINGEAEYDRSGSSVSLSADGGIVAIGAPLNNGSEEDSGHVRVYRNVEGIWTQIGDDIDGEMQWDESGSAVSLSADGSMVAIGAYFRFRSGTNPGYVPVYRNVSGSWILIGKGHEGTWAGETVLYYGTSVSLNSDGRAVAVGSPLNDDGGTDSGNVRVYAFGGLEGKPPVLRMPTWNLTNGFGVLMEGEVGNFYRIEWSPNLVDWYLLTRIIAESAQIEIEDPEFDGAETRFYRAVAQ